jgi:hypothetical protein
MAWHVVEKAAITASPRTKNKEQRTKNKEQRTKLPTVRMTIEHYFPCLANLLPTVSVLTANS